MSFITKTDLSQDIYSEILTGLTRANDAKIATACNEAQAEINGYVCARYDSEDLFGKTAEERNLTILAIARTIAIYKLHKVCNKMNELVRVEYEDAIALLMRIQKGQFILEGAKLFGQTDIETPTSQITRTGNIKRENYI
ncbi:MAG: DUF1320 family protein [Bacteroidales bacterium]|nr:DUF1320 family protein [Bacteroidales bacterium]